MSPCWELRWVRIVWMEPVEGEAQNNESKPSSSGLSTFSKICIPVPVHLRVGNSLTSPVKCRSTLVHNQSKSAFAPNSDCKKLVSTISNSGDRVAINISENVSLAHRIDVSSEKTTPQPPLRSFYPNILDSSFSLYPGIPPDIPSIPAIPAIPAIPTPAISTPGLSSRMFSGMSLSPSQTPLLDKESFGDDQRFYFPSPGLASFSSSSSEYGVQKRKKKATKRETQMPIRWMWRRLSFQIFLATTHEDTHRWTPFCLRVARSVIGIAMWKTLCWEFYLEATYPNTYRRETLHLRTLQLWKDVCR